MADSGAATAASACKKMRFSISDDLLLLREVVATNPYEDPSRWKDITSRVNEASGRTYSVRAVRERTERLVKLFKEEDTANLRK